MKTTLNLRDDLVAREGPGDQRTHDADSTDRRRSRTPPAPARRDSFAKAAWLDRARKASAAGQQTLVLLPVVVSGFLRITTNPRVFSQADDVADAIAFIDAVLATPGAAAATIAADWPALRALLLRLGRGGNVVTDAWIASSVQSCSEHLVTFDQDFLPLLPPRDLTVLQA